MTDDTDKATASVEPVDTAPSGRDEDLRRLAITSREHTTYEWNGYRYSNAPDAIAAAKRGAR